MVGFDFTFVRREADAVERPLFDVFVARDFVPPFALVGVGESVFVGAVLGVLFTGVVVHEEHSLLVSTDVARLSWALGFAVDVRDRGLELGVGFFFGERRVAGELFCDTGGVGMKHERNSVMMIVMMTIRRVMMSTSGEVRVVMVGRVVDFVDDDALPVGGVGFSGCLADVFDAISHEVLEVFAQLSAELFVSHSV